MVTTTQILGGRYVLGEVLGTGGMATVWRATDELLGREVAVKVLSPHYAADAAFVARFEREARHAAQLSHPRLVTVFDCGIDDGTAFIVMELVAGRTLRQVLDDAGILPPGQAVGIAAAVCEALEAAHAAGLVHRDIKPANIVVSDGDVKVLDFGIARADGSADGTPTLGALGTVAYLSPEQASGGPAGPQSDLYSLGCVLFEMLTGEPPFTADSAVGMAYRHVHDDPGPPSARQPGVPLQLDGITARLLAKDPAARPASAATARADMLAAVQADATAVLTTPHEEVVPSALSRRRFRRPTWAEVVLASAFAGALVALVAVLLSGTTGQAAPRAAPGVPPSASHPSFTSSPAAHNVRKRAHLRPGTRQSARPAPKRSARPAPRRHTASQANPLPPLAAAAATFVGDLAEGVADGQVSPQAGQDLYNHLQQLLFGPPGQTSQQVKQQYAQLMRSYIQHRKQGQITGHAAIALRRALRAIAAAVGAT
jgi:eukaryotic-like serine/threonine-protein kinase